MAGFPPPPGREREYEKDNFEKFGHMHYQPDAGFPADNGAGADGAGKDGPAADQPTLGD